MISLKPRRCFSPLEEPPLNASFSNEGRVSEPGAGAQGRGIAGAGGGGFAKRTSLFAYNIYVFSLLEIAT